MKQQTFNYGDKVKDLSGIEGTVISLHPDSKYGTIRVAFGEDGKSNWRYLKTDQLTPVNEGQQQPAPIDDEGEKITIDKKDFDDMLSIIKTVSFWFGNEANYPKGTNGYRINQDAEAILNRINTNPSVS